MENTKVTTLDNGLRIVSDPMPGVSTTTLGIWVDAGARHETEAEHGLAHFLEHMAFKGTQRRSAKDIAEEIEAVGGHLNACTMREQTSYYGRVLGQDVPLALDILGDILKNSVFDTEEIAREKQVVLQEIAQVQDTPDDLIFDDLQAACFPDAALGRPILGTPQSVQALSRDQLSHYLSAHYTPRRLVLSAAGCVDHEQIVEIAQSLFGETSSSAPVSQRMGAKFQPSENRRSRDAEQAHVAFAFEGVPFGHEDFFTAQVYTGALGGGMSSRLFQEVREKRGLCYSVFSFASSYRDSGLIGVYAGTSEEDLGELAPVMADEMQRMNEDLSEEETARARAQLKAGLLMSRESSASRAEQAARDLIVFGRLWSADELVAAVDRVDASAVRRFGAALTRRSKPALAAVGAIDGLAPYDAVAAKFA